MLIFQRRWSYWEKDNDVFDHPSARILVFEKLLKKFGGVKFSLEGLDIASQHIAPLATNPVPRLVSCKVRLPQVKHILLLPQIEPTRYISETKRISSQSFRSETFL
jgi:hypothetical protein